MRPFSSMTYAMRLAYSSDVDFAAPYATPTVRSVSQSSGNGRPSFSAKRRFSSCVSKLMP